MNSKEQLREVSDLTKSQEKLQKAEKLRNRINQRLESGIPEHRDPGVYFSNIAVIGDTGLKLEKDVIPLLRDTIDQIQSQIETKHRETEEKLAKLYPLRDLYKDLLEKGAPIQTLNSSLLNRISYLEGIIQTPGDKKESPEKITPTENLQLVPTKKAELPALSPEENKIAAQVTKLLPLPHLHHWLGVQHLDPELYTRQISEFAIFAHNFQEGKIPLIDPIEVVGQTTQKRDAIVITRIRQILTITLEENSTMVSRVSRISREINMIIDWLGRVTGREVVKKAIDSLSEAERGLFISTASLNMLEKLDYLDLDECTGVRIGTYIRTAVFDPQEERDRNLTTLLEAVEFCDANNICEMMNFIMALPYKGLILNRLIETARYHECLDILVNAFRCHPESSPLAVELDEELIRGYNFRDVVPYSRDIDIAPQFKRKSVN